MADKPLPGPQAVRGHAPSPLALGRASRWPWWAKAMLGLLAAAVLAAAGYLAALYYPDKSPPGPDELESRIAAVLSVPADSADEKLVGDYLVERFYALDVATGERYVADLLKGRIHGVQTAAREDGTRAIVLLLDLRNLQRDRDLYAAFVDAVAPPEQEDFVEYLGLRAFVGNFDAFALNYDGNLPEERREFRGPNGEETYAFLLARSLARQSLEPRLIGIDGYNYLLSSSDRFPYFRSQFGVEAVFVSELIIVDATARPQARVLFRLRQEFPGAR